MSNFAQSSKKKVEHPKKNRFVGSFYNDQELNYLFEAVKGKKVPALPEKADQKPVIDEVVRSRGLEPPRGVSPHGPEPCASANSATTANSPRFD